ncbi:3D domain-containing protein [Enterococcus casseliflavus]|uniref:3D domain-containing protein n=1 Tax=Enterococcus casseliflavus TaxID=37734 RepID=UPI0039A64A87
MWTTTITGGYRYYDGYVVVAAPPAYPFYTLLEINYNGQILQGIVLDRGGAIQGSHFDICVSDESTAYSLGVGTGTIKVIGSLK